MSKKTKTVKISDGVVAPVKDVMDALENYKTAALDLSKVVDHACNAMKQSNYATTEALRRQVAHVSKSVNSLMAGLDERLFDTAVTNMPDAYEVDGLAKSEEMIRSHHDSLIMLTRGGEL